MAVIGEKWQFHVFNKSCVRGMQTLSLWHEGGAEGDCDCVFPEGGAETEKGHKPTQYSSEWRLQRTSAVASS